jgi:hypothetical protein
MGRSIEIASQDGSPDASARYRLPISRPAIWRANSTRAGRFRAKSTTPEVQRPSR